MKTKPVTPYARLLNQAMLYHSKVAFPRVRSMWHYSAKAIDGGETWAMISLRERIIAANALGYDVRLTITGDNSIAVQYVECPPDPEFA